MGQTLVATDACSHAGSQQVLGVDLGAVLQLGPFRRTQQLLDLGGSLARLQAVRLIGDHREALAIGRGTERSGWCGR